MGFTHPNNPIQLNEVEISGKSGGKLQSIGISFQDRSAGTMSEWQDATGGKFSKDYALADLQWDVSYGDAFRNYQQAQVDALISEIHNGQLNFLKGSYNFTAYALQNTGDITLAVGYGLTLTGVGASVGVPMMATGKGMSMVGGSMNAVSSLANGDYRGAAINGISIGVGGAGSAFIKRSALTPLSKSILDGNLNLKINGVSRLINQ